ncbi:MAG: hypothetical protein JWR19_2159 [Pedosphaera sp.]|nr:hypothetical protein [Pedosphaera sp.]
MNKLFKFLLRASLLAMLFFVMFAAFNALAQTDTNFPGVPTDSNTVPAVGVHSADVSNAVTNMIGGLVVKYPWMSTVIFVVGVLRLCMKPIFTIVESVVKSTTSTSDDAVLAKFEGGAIYKWLFWGLDLFASIKTPSAANASANPLIPAKT